MKIKNLIDERLIFAWIKNTKNINRNFGSKHWNAFNKVTQGHKMASFYYFIFKALIKAENFDQEKFNSIMNQDFYETFTKFVLTKHRREKVNRKGKLKKGQLKSFLYFLNRKLPYGERIYLHYEYNGKPFGKNGKLFAITEGNIEKENYIWKEKRLVVNPTNQFNPSGKIIFPGDPGSAIQLKLQFPD